MVIVRHIAVIIFVLQVTNSFMDSISVMTTVQGKEFHNFDKVNPNNSISPEIRDHEQRRRKSKKYRCATNTRSKLEQRLNNTKPLNFSVFPHPYRFKLDNSDFCVRGVSLKDNNSTILDFVILVESAIENFDQRQAIRETWGSDASSNNNTGSVRIGFLLGSASGRGTDAILREEMVLKEFDKYHDIMQEDFVDSYQNLTIKSVMLLKWATEFCQNAKFVLKADDDLYVNVDRLLGSSKNVWKTTENVIYGYISHRAKPRRNQNSKWYVSRSEYPKSLYPDYIATSYAISSDVIPLLYNISSTVPPLRVEDVFVTGLCAEQVGIQRCAGPGFTMKKRKVNGCFFRNVVTGHHLTSSEMRQIWNERNQKC